MSIADFSVKPKITDEMIKESWIKPNLGIEEKENSGCSVADKAKEIVYSDREKCYGEPGKNLRVTAEMWSGYLGIRLSSEDVCNMMILLKVARLKNSPAHQDSMVDIIGYTLLQERIQKGVE